ncbi:MAG TPA: 30S ribosomal protein S6 [Solirubrobacteraceae bacterium]|jgi:small subunit ribosomal protein S6|nr:30S ribosomal protein S6 [Solirubrobacteraceae bacterium]
MSEPIIYDLMLMLSSSAEEERRAKILADVEEMITSAGGRIERNDDWGMRTMAYEITHQADAEYHLLQFSAPATLLEPLSYNLKILDGVLRFRIIKVLPGTPPPPEPRAVPAAAAPAADE